MPFSYSGTHPIHFVHFFLNKDFQAPISPRKDDFPSKFQNPNTQDVSREIHDLHQGR
jgi:hypothetical protein